MHFFALRACLMSRSSEHGAENNHLSKYKQDFTGGPCHRQIQKSACKEREATSSRYLSKWIQWGQRQEKAQRERQKGNKVTKLNFHPTRDNICWFALVPQFIYFQKSNINPISFPQRFCPWRRFSFIHDSAVSVFSPPLQILFCVWCAPQSSL